MSDDLSVVIGVIVPILLLGSSTLGVYISWSKKIENDIYKNKKED